MFNWYSDNIVNDYKILTRKGGAMKRSLMAIVILFVVLYPVIFAESLYAWWSQPNNMHYKLITLSESKLKSGGLYDGNALYKASSCPDGPNKSIDHKDPSRIKVNFCSTVGMALTGVKIGPVNCRSDCKSTIDCIGRTFHYLADLADSTHADNHIEDSRKHAHDRFVKIKRDPGMSQQVKEYNHALAGFNNNSVAHYNAVVKYIHDTTSSAPKNLKDLKDELRAANNKGRGIARDTARDKVFVKNFALIEAGQDKLIDLYKKELAAYASGICIDTPAYCEGLEKQINQACHEKNVAKVKSYIQLAKNAKALNDPGCRDLRNIINNEKRKLQECSGPVTQGGTVAPTIREWLVWHSCGAKGGFWCRLNVEFTTEKNLEQKLKKKPTVLGHYPTKVEAIRNTCNKEIKMDNIWRGGQFACGARMTKIRGGDFCVDDFVKTTADGKHNICRE